jgi:hypothetical protein
MRKTVAGQTRLNGSNAIHPGLVIARGRPAATCASVALTRLWQVAVQADMCGFGLALWCLCPASTVGNVAASRAQGRYSAKTEAIGTRMPDGNGAMHALQAPPAGWVSPSICAAAAAASQQLLHSGCPLSSLFTKFISNSFLHTVLPLCKSFRHLAIVGSRTVLVKILSQSLGRVQRHPAWTRLSSMLHGDRLWS